MNLHEKWQARIEWCQQFKVVLETINAIGYPPPTVVGAAHVAWSINSYAYAPHSARITLTHDQTKGREVAFYIPGVWMKHSDLNPDNLHDLAEKFLRDLQPRLPKNKKEA